MRKGRRPDLLRILSILCLLILAFVLLEGIEFELGAAPPSVSDHYIRWGVTQTGAVNLVAAIYLNYRVYDTLGEAIVLFAALLGIGFLLKRPRWNRRP